MASGLVVMAQSDLQRFNPRRAGDGQSSDTVSGIETVSSDPSDGACFRLMRRIDEPSSLRPPSLSSDHSLAVAELLPLLLCGEESAAIAFDGLRERECGAYARRRLTMIASDEHRHEMLLRHLRRQLPNHELEPQLQRAVRRFFVRFANRNFVRHVAKIVALDSAVCIILGSVRARGLPLAKDAVTAKVFRHIHLDEARHVRIARELLSMLGPHDSIIDDALEAREGLASLLESRGAAFDRLQVDPGRLFTKVRNVAPSLFA